MTTQPDHKLSLAVKIRRASFADAAEIERLQQASLWYLGGRSYAPAVVDAFIKACPTLPRELIAKATYYVVELDGEIAACGGWSAAQGGAGQPGSLVDRWDTPVAFAPAADTALLRAIFVHPKWARHGLGRQIMAHAEHHAAEAGCGAAELLATLGGVPLYEVIGYQRVADYSFVVGPGLKMPVVHMRKKLVAASGRRTAA